MKAEVLHNSSALDDCAEAMAMGMLQLRQAQAEIRSSGNAVLDKLRKERVSSGNAPRTSPPLDPVEEEDPVGDAPPLDLVGDAPPLDPVGDRRRPWTPLGPMGSDQSPFFGEALSSTLSQHALREAGMTPFEAAVWWAQQR